MLFPILALHLLPTLTSSCFTKRSTASPPDWHYSSPDSWADDNPAYGSCRNGTHQSPISLSDSTLSASSSNPHFTYNGSWSGTLTNNGHGLQFDFSEAGNEDLTSLPHLRHTTASGEEETVYLSTWHTHAPAEHVTNGDRATAEMHFVHVDAAGNPRVVVAFLIDPSERRRDARSDFFTQVGAFPRPEAAAAERKGAEAEEERLNERRCSPEMALAQVNNYKRFWTYSGSLTTPPCSEGIRWFVAKETMVMGDEQLQELLSVSRFSARPTRPVWLHDVGL